MFTKCPVYEEKVEHGTQNQKPAATKRVLVRQ